MKRFNRIIGVILSVTIILGLISSYSVLVGAEEVFPGVLSLEDDSDIVFDEAVGWSNNNSLPASVDLTSKFPAPQKQVGESCVGWAIGYALKSYQEYDKRGWTKNSVNHLFNPYYIYK